MATSDRLDLTDRGPELVVGVVGVPEYDLQMKREKDDHKSCITLLMSVLLASGCCCGMSFAQAAAIKNTHADTVLYPQADINRCCKWLTQKAKQPPHHRGLPGLTQEKSLM